MTTYVGGVGGVRQILLVRKNEQWNKWNSRKYVMELLTGFIKVLGITGVDDKNDIGRRSGI